MDTSNISDDSLTAIALILKDQIKGVRADVIKNALEHYEPNGPPSSIKSSPNLITVKEAAKRLSVSERFIYTLIDQGSLRRIKINRACRLLESDISLLIEQRLIQGGDE
ncbi:hypothetical protein LNTAR_16423 [Lentisphaera araneosa HTCC2155]|uniref:Helix-turn-helix domain-containing protein n=1 Tax=Lentisphaera araneosa HTCC2155 TaxID=313628 RepID=A6DQ99_9BACT|nr:helix-turn-helix domain-containing protein [Lentisphaera araneosa]EDM26150.1 hypothetical protein LNTAR_16423 [Lentisphaera araneosa HTCC2155]